MPSRRILKSVAHDVAHAIVSRNDDVGGYWALGQLLSQAIATNQSSYRIDLLCGASMPPVSGTPLSSLPPSWAQSFLKNIEHQKVDRGLIARAEAVIDFDLGRSRRSVVHAGRTEYAFTCQLMIQDDRGKTYTASTDGWCHEHDSTVELQSRRGA